MPNGLITRRAALAGTAAASVALATRRGWAAAPATVNIGFFTETKPTMIAKGEGWFEAGAGGKLNWTEMGSGADINTAITAGSCDIGLATGSAATAAGIAQGLPFKLIGMVDNIGPAEEMTVRTAANIKTPADFRGKKVATPFGSTSHFRLLGFLKTNGLTQRDVTVLDMKAAAIVAAWSRGEIDAAYVWAPAKSKILADGGAVFPTYEALDKAGYVIADLVVVRDGFAKQYPEAVTGFLKAYGRALTMYQQKPDDSAVLVAKQAGVTPAVALADMKEYDFVSLKDQASDAWLGGTAANPGKLAHVLKGTADFLVEQKSIKSAPAVDAFQKAIDTGYLTKALA
ncbi:ABC transporter substrate-binding protein [Acidisphaera sp. L21]|uniref:taurine ABC transporter substrate-binding protein n=1 Tax=Acidisphaera sp. L21 TaxID=1641851 RepID=UPI00131AB669|nr:ABC transporter substrate-binding protein [Acidisphaera sp. L21]